MDDRPEWLEAMSVLTLRPGDLVVLKTGRILDEYEIDRINKAFESVLMPAFPGVKFVVVHDIDIAVLRAEQATANEVA